MNPVSPSSSVSSSPGSPYNPLNAPAYPNTNAIFCPIPSSSSSAGAENPQPSTSARGTAHKTNQTAKRKLSESSDSSSESECASKKRKIGTPEQPKKAKCKRKHVESTCKATPAKRPCITSSSDSDDSDEEGPSQRSNPENAPWFRACRYNRQCYKEKKEQLNRLFIQRLQRELNHAQRSLTPEDSLAASLFETAAEHKRTVSPKGPFVFVKQQSGFKNRLDWGKLHKALCCIEASSSSSSRNPITNSSSQRAIQWLKRFFSCINTREWSRTYLSGPALTHLCAQALAAQGLAVTSDNQGLTHLGGREGCFISGSDLTAALNNTSYVTTEYALSFLRTPSSRNHDTQRNYQRNENYHLDLEATAATAPQEESSSETE